MRDALLLSPSIRSVLPAQPRWGCTGWIILVVCTCGKIMSSPGQSPCIGPTTDAIMIDLDLSESAITLLYFFGTLGSALSLPQSKKPTPSHESCFDPL